MEIDPKMPSVAPMRRAWSGAERRLRRGLIALLAGMALLAPVLATFGGPALAQPTRGEFPAGGIVFTVPDKWSLEGTRQKLVLVAPSEDAFIELTLLEPATGNALRAQLARMLTVYLEDTVLGDSGEDVTVNAMPAFRVKGTGSSDATSVEFVALALQPTPKQPVLVLAYAAQETFADQAPVFDAFLKSLKRR